MRKLVFALFLFSIIYSQTTVNPDISVIGDLIGTTDGKTTDFSSSGIELAMQGYVNPFAKAFIYLHKHNDESPIELEEAYLSVERGLPLNLGARFGKMRPDFSKINPEHMHTYYYILPSTAVQNILGEEMWSAFGLEVNSLLPLPWYSNLSVGVFQSSISLEHHHHDEEEEHQEEHEDDHEEDTEEVSKAFSGRLSHFFDLNSVTHLELGTSYYLELEKTDNYIFGGDFKFKWRPDTYRSLTIQGDYFNKHRHDDEIINAGYIWTNYQFNRVWNVGLIYDFTDDLDEETYNSIGAFVGFSPAEESSVFRFRVNQEHHGDEDPNLTFVAQIIWSLGPHKPHQF